MVSIEVRNLDRIVARFKGARRLIEEELEDATDSVLAEGARRLAAYPSRRAGQRYVRTGRLGRGWSQTDRRFVVQGNAKRAVLRNMTPYARYVQGEQIAWMHKGRWATVEAVQRSLDGFANQKLEAAGRRVAAQLEAGA